MATVLANHPMSANNPNEPVESSETAAFSGGVASLLKGSSGRAGDGSKLTPLEERQLQAQMGAGRGQAAAYFLDRSNETVEIGDAELKGDEAGEDWVNVGKTTLMFKGCVDSHYTVTGLVAKILVDRCERCTFTLAAKVMTSTLEIYKATDVTFNIETTLKTVQADLNEGVALNFAHADDFDRIVWAGTEALTVAFADAPDAGLATSFADMRAEYGPILRADIDQFIIRILGDNVAVNERIVRLDNGFPTTARERAEFEERQEENMRKMAEAFYGDNIRIPKRKTGPKILPNAKCPCGSGKKYKKCCMNRPGVQFTQAQVDAVSGGKKKKK